VNLNSPDKKHAFETGEQHTQAILKAIPDMIFRMNGTYIFLDYHASHEDLYTNPENFINQSVDEVLPEYLARLTKEKIDLTLKTRSLQVFKYILAHPGDQSEHLFECRMTPYNGTEVVAIVRDITEHHLLQQQIEQQEEALDEQEKIYKQLVNRLPDGVYKSTHEGRFVDVNPAMVEMLGYSSKEELMAVDIKKALYIEPTDREKLITPAGQNEIQVYQLKKKDGSAIWVEDHGWYVADEEGNIQYHEGIIRNVTRRITEQEKLKELNATKDKLFSLIAHDLKGPFNSILGFADLLLESFQEMDQETLKKSLSVIYASSKQAFGLLENLLIWCHSQTGKIPFEPANVNLCQKVDENISLLQLQAQTKEIGVDVEIPNDLSVFADRNMLDTILRNLLTNAIKFTQRGGKIKVSAKPEKDFLTIMISDNGIGIPKENIEEIFRIDSKLTTPGTEKEKGSGLGLILCREFMEKHNGSISVESTKGKGSTFVCKFPLPKT
jgi:PAS domain S-box-containing protein